LACFCFDATFLACLSDRRADNVIASGPSVLRVHLSLRSDVTRGEPGEKCQVTGREHTTARGLVVDGQIVPADLKRQRAGLANVEPHRIERLELLRRLADRLGVSDVDLRHCLPAPISGVPHL
jgi:hypothetical protein